MRRYFDFRTVSCLLAAGAIAGVALGLAGQSACAAEPSLESFIPGSHVADVYDSKRDGKRDHTGVDVAAPQGTPIAAPADATVVEVSDLFHGEPRYGKAVVLKLDDGTLLWVTHLDGYSVRAGDRLSAGDVFATVGMTQFMKVPHVHIEAYRETGVDRRVDPAAVWPFLARG